MGGKIITRPSIAWTFNLIKAFSLILGSQTRQHHLLQPFPLLQIPLSQQQYITSITCILRGGPIFQKMVIFWWFFQLSPSCKILFGVSKHIEWGVFEGFWMQSEAQNVIFASILDAGSQSILAKISFYPNFPPYPPKWAKKRVFWSFF